MSQTAFPYILWLRWKWFYVEDELEGPPLAIVRDKVVLDANRQAIKRGMQIGMPARQAEHLVQGCTFRKWDREQYVEKEKHWLDLCCDFTGRIEPIDQHIAALDLSGHPNRIDITERLIRALGERIKLPLRYGAGPSKWIANLAAKGSGGGDAMDDPAGFLSRFPVELLLPVAPEHRERLIFLGYQTIGDVVRISKSTLRDQFGEEGLTIFLAARGGLSDPVQAVYPRDSLRECFMFESPVEDWESIKAARSLLASRLSERLDGRQSSYAELSVEYEDGATQTHKRSFTKPICNALTTTAALRLLLPDEWHGHLARGPHARNSGDKSHSHVDRGFIPGENLSSAAESTNYEFKQPLVTSTEGAWHGHPARVSPARPAHDEKPLTTDRKRRPLPPGGGQRGGESKEPPPTCRGRAGWGFAQNKSPENVEPTDNPKLPSPARGVGERSEPEGRDQSAPEKANKGLPLLVGGGEGGGRNLRCPNLEGQTPFLDTDSSPVVPLPLRGGGVGEGVNNSPQKSITALRITLRDLEPIRQRQHRLIESSMRPEAEAAVYYIQSTFGDQSVQKGCDIVPPRRARVLREWRHATGWH